MRAEQKNRQLMRAVGLGVLAAGLMTLALSTPSLTWAGAVLLPRVQAAPGDQIEIPINLEGMENLAGMKLVLTYDSKLLQFHQERKTQVAQGLMHIVNPNTPGKLIVVMAGARGIEVKNGPIIYLKFKVSNKAAPGTKSALKIEELQLMTEELKNVKATTQDGELTVIEKPESSGKGDSLVCARKA